MTRSIPMGCSLVVFFFALLAFHPAYPADRAFRELSMKFEVNETDGDGEVVWSVKASEGLEWLKIFDPGGRLRVFVVSHDEGKGIDPLGIAQMDLETAEPSVTGVEKAFPPGTYAFVARTVGGARLVGNVEFSTDRLPAPVFSPMGQRDVHPAHAVVKWHPVQGAAGYHVEIENDELEVNLTAKLPGSTSRFKIPEEFLLAGKEYDISVAVINMAGNVSVAESSFVTVAPE